MVEKSIGSVKMKCISVLKDLISTACLTVKLNQQPQYKRRKMLLCDLQMFLFLAGDSYWLITGLLWLVWSIPQYCPKNVSHYNHALVEQQKKGSFVPSRVLQSGGRWELQRPSIHADLVEPITLFTLLPQYYNFSTGKMVAIVMRENIEMKILTLWLLRWLLNLMSERWQNKK